MNISDLLNTDPIIQQPEYIPESLPPTMLDVDRDKPMDMNLPLADPCPSCGAFNMQVGHYVTGGICSPCYFEAIKELGETE